ncbi:16S rRNA (cytosine(967)-C(5))-methyltransferase RsmB [Bacillus sp. FJAT-47783]|uniref:16S rRNA (cytosine(967)-C(5))-methyltransferase RsmB n=1 Tax=Bacillus sp. FJAT-47783 TaxID=2922712 RepID=UPI001FAC5E8F|nr:16S rRNA (cytosine(967)-C(5))-methyltransferase RsmB [Bacillus sp. FJAT-47783]
MKKIKNVRTVALDGLNAIENNQAYSNLLLNSLIEKNKLPQKDIPLLTEIIYGTLQRKLTLDYYLSFFLKGKKKIDDWVQNLLRLSLYQMVYLDRIPDRAVLFEAVEIAKARGHRGIASMVNGTLRNIQRNGLPEIEEIKDPIERISVKTSTPKWLVKRLSNQYGIEVAEQIFLEQLKPAKQTARVNVNKATVENVLELLQKDGLEVTKGEIVPESIQVIKGNIAHSHVFKQGLYTIQDESSMLVAKALDINEGEMVLDSCAAPGGKSTHIAEMLSNTGKVISLDLHEHKVKLIEGQASRLGLTNVETKVMDARKVGEHFQAETFDKILVDAPCTGFGVIRRKPEIKYSKTDKDVHSLATIQKEILQAVAPLLKRGGLLVYSTCTVDQEENSNVIYDFLQQTCDFIKDDTLASRMPEKVAAHVDNGELQILPQYFQSDGFYISALRKKV